MLTNGFFFIREYLYSIYLKYMTIIINTYHIYYTCSWASKHALSVGKLGDPQACGWKYWLHFLQYDGQALHNWSLIYRSSFQYSQRWYLWSQVELCESPSFPCLAQGGQDSDLRSGQAQPNNRALIRLRRVDKTQYGAANRRLCRIPTSSREVQAVSWQA